MGHPGFFEHAGEKLGLFDGDGAHQHGLALLVQLLEVLHDGRELLLLALVDHVRVVEAHHGLVRGYEGHVQVVDLLEFHGLGVGGAGHARKLFVHAEVNSGGDGGQRLVLALHLHSLLGLQGLMPGRRSSAVRQ